MARKIFALILGFMTLASAALASPRQVSAPIEPQKELEDRLERRTVKNPSNADRLDPISTIVYRHGDVSWLPSLAKQAGWPDRTIGKLTHIVLRESGGCPNRRGGDIVDKNCVITGVSEWNHRSDTGLLQINGVHWKPDHPQYHGLICERMGICTQEPLLDAFTNLKAGKLLFDVAGWSPWRVVKN